LFSNLSYATAPANDTCSNALEIRLGYGTGSYFSDSLAIDSAGVQVGEFFHSSLVSSGNDKKTVWFKFYLPVRRAVDVELKQNTNAISIKDCGFTTYKSNSCLPTSSQATAAKLTTLNQFGSSFHPCMDPGWYMVQVSSKARAKGRIFLEITTSIPAKHSSVTNAEYDLCDSAYDFGNAHVGQAGYAEKFVDVEFGCYTVDDSSELYKDLGSNYRAYNQSAWFEFTAAGDNDKTLFSVVGRSRYLGSSDTFAYRIFEGNCGTNMTLLDSGWSAQVNSSKCRNRYYSPWPLDLSCMFDSGKVYRIQFLFEEYFDETVRFNIEDRTSAYTTESNQPKLGIARNVDTLRGSSEFYYGFTCASNMLDAACGTSAQPASVQVASSPFVYTLNEWVYFYLDGTSSLDIRLLNGINNNYDYYQNLAFRLFKDSITNSCSDVDTNSIIAQQYGTGYITLNCLEPGFYSLQLLGTDSSIYRCEGAMHLGGDYRVQYTVTSLPDRNRFGLYTIGAADSLNELDPLPPYSYTYGQTDTISCFENVVPEQHCDSTKRHITYRVFNVPDSGLVVMDQFYRKRFYSPGYYKRYDGVSRLYKGNALALRDIQSVSAFPDTLKGLRAWGDCWSSNSSHCLEPGTYTLATFAEDISLGETETPRLYYRVGRTKFNSYSKAEFIDSIRSYGNVYGQVDTFTCRTNPDTVAGISCGRRNGYHVFYLDTTSLATITVSSYYTPLTISLFKGDIRKGKQAVSFYRDESGWSCVRYGKTTSTCKPLQAGWYTVMVSGNNALSYDSSHSLATASDFRGLYNNYGNYRVQIRTSAPTVIPRKYDRTYRAAFVDSLVNNNQPLSYDTNYSVRPNMPQHLKLYTLPQEILECELDTPLVHPDSFICLNNTTDVVYYVFNLAKRG